MGIIKAKKQRPDFEWDEEDRRRLEARISATTVEHLPTQSIHPNPKNAKRHPERQLALLAENIRKFGMTNPLLVDEKDMVLAGHARLEAIKLLGLPEVPVIRLTHLTAREKAGVALADNKLAELGEWDIEMLAAELKDLTDPSADLTFDWEITGFDTVDVDGPLGAEIKADRKQDPADEVPPLESNAPAISKLGDVWYAGRHLVFCGDALRADSYQQLLNGERATFVFTDPPYNVPIVGHVTKRGAIPEFAMASGEMTSEEFTAFLRTALGHVADNVVPGAVVDVCMDWSHLGELFAATRHIFGPPKNMAVWVKPNGGLGSFYRSRHEHVAIFVMPGAAPINNFRLGGRGRYRTNVWEYAGLNAFGAQRDALLAMHPTVKPVALVVDAIKDCSKRNDLVLDPFAGSGTTLIACQKSGRIARLIEYEPRYCDVILKRFEAFTGEEARLASTQEAFSVVAKKRGELETAGAQK